MLVETKGFSSEAPNGINLDAYSAEMKYETNFGRTPTGTVYLDVMRGIDRRKDFLSQEQVKSGIEMKSSITVNSSLMAVGTTYSTTSGSIPVLFPTVVDPVIYDVTKRDTPLASGGLPRVTNKGLYADYVRMTAKQTATWKAEMASLPSATTTEDRTATSIRYAYATGAISNPALVASQSQGWANILQNEVNAAYASLKELEENTIINGDTTNATYTNAFNGLIASITTNYTNKSSAPLQTTDLDTAFQTIREARGHPTIAITDNATFNRVKQLLRPYLIATSGQPLNFGFDEIIYDNVPIIRDLFMPTTATARALLVLDTSNTAGGPNIQIRVLQDATYVLKAHTYDALEFYVSLYETMIILKEAWCYRIYNLA